MPTDEFAITICSNCRARLKVPAKYASMDGKEVSCPKCRSSFRLKLEQPSEIEQAAIESEQDNAKSGRRRTKDEIRREHIDRALEGFSGLHDRLTKIAENPKSSEEEVRRWVIDALKIALGYEDDEIDTEVRVLGKRVDVALKRNNEIFLVLEIKNIRKTLTNSVRDQAVGYASTLSADWAVVTNGKVWKLYRVTPVQGKDPLVVEVFGLALLDEDGVSITDAENLYLLTARAIFSGDSDANYHQTACTLDRRIFAALSSERVTRSVRRELIENYRSETETKVNLDDEFVAIRMKELILLKDLWSKRKH